MAKCPKCGKNLAITNIKPNCPNCGVNLLYYKIEERLEVDAINAEIEHAKTQKRIDRVKNATIGIRFPAFNRPSCSYSSYCRNILPSLGNTSYKGTVL